MFLLQTLVEKFSWVVLVSSCVANFVGSLLFVGSILLLLIILVREEDSFFLLFSSCKENERMVLDYFAIIATDSTVHLMNC